MNGLPFNSAAETDSASDFSVDCADCEMEGFSLVPSVLSDALQADKASMRAMNELAVRLVFISDSVIFGTFLGEGRPFDLNHYGTMYARSNRSNAILSMGSRISFYAFHFSRIIFLTVEITLGGRRKLT